MLTHQEVLYVLNIINASLQLTFVPKIIDTDLGSRS